MNSVLIYLFQSGICLGALYVFYWLFLKSDTFFTTNRTYLILSLAASFIFPMVDISINSGQEKSYLVLLEPIVITAENVKSSLLSNLSITDMIIGVYLFGVVVSLILLIYRISQIGILIYKYRISKMDGLKVVCLPKEFTPFSFFNIVFINEGIRNHNQLNEILAHEKVHIKQKHSADIIFLEIINVIQWFNPFIWLYKKSIKNLHEFQADQGVLQTGYNKKAYQQLLLNQTFGMQLNTLSNNFNSSILKTRFNMMTKTKTKKAAILKLLFVLPTAMILTLFFSISVTNKVIAQTDNETKKVQQKQEPVIKKVPAKSKPVKSKKITDAYTVAEEMPKFPGGDAARVKFLAGNIKYPENARKNGIDGRVFITYIVEKDGSITGVEILRGFDKECDAEALRVVKMMPKWIPGKIDGKPVRTIFNIPIHFKLDNSKKKDPPPPPKK